MRIAQVIGRVVLSRPHPLLRGGTLLVVTSLNLAGLRGNAEGRGEPFVMYDELGAHQGDLVGVSEGAEASAPYYPDVKPIDAYNAAILENLEVDA